MENTWEKNDLGSEQWGQCASISSGSCWGSCSLPHLPGMGGPEAGDSPSLCQPHLHPPSWPNVCQCSHQSQLLLAAPGSNSAPGPDQTRRDPEGLCDWLSEGETEASPRSGIAGVGVTSRPQEVADHPPCPGSLRALPEAVMFNLGQNGLAGHTRQSPLGKVESLRLEWCQARSSWSVNCHLSDQITNE